MGYTAQLAGTQIVSNV